MDKLKAKSFMVGASILILLLIALSPELAVAENEDEFIVCYIIATPKETPQGSILDVTFGVFYPGYCICGDPCELKPRPGQTQPTATFEVRGSPEVLYTDIPVTPTGRPGEYTADLDWPNDAPLGQVVVFIIKESLYDGKANGPDQDTSHVETSDPVDDSSFESIAAVPPPAPSILDLMPGGATTAAALLGLLLGLLIAILLLFASRRLKKKQQETKS